jgi:frataxin-like iron-binding protein CyaY
MSSTAADGAGQPAGHRADPSASPSGLSDVEYRQRTDHLLSSLEATVDRWLQDDVIDIDSQDLDINNNFDAFRVDVASMANASAQVSYILTGARYSGANPMVD